ncbi:hypothetical protein F5X68DRAFT_278084 [Plectosphaerella plurivora]|uniref:SYO1-like TPR repeats domain-containing protein n=1 Tax=Plectosphaerella plurivora TaxID=936078 RepID=A0A9P8V5M2_9PEZI|nr:hypothetical protein F5X68DRAFT_278084 [Plectosphaerella plurivora]
MAKSRRNRARPRKDPLTKAAKPPTDPELAAIREKSVLPVLRDLTSSEPNARASAAAAVANLVSDTRCRKLFLREQIVNTVLTQTITDASLESRAAGWDILRLLAEEEEADFCIHLYRQDVLTALDHAASAVVENLKLGRRLGTVEAKFIWALAASLVALVSVMCEAQDDILEAIVGLKSALSLLAHAVALPASPAPLRYDALSCFMTLAEDNKRVAEFLVADEAPKPMTALLDLQAGKGPARVLACGVLHNVFAVLGWHAGGLGNKDLSDATLVRSLASALDDTNEEKDLPLSCQWSKPAEVLQLALEVLASIGTSLQVSMANGKGGDDEWSGIEDKDDDAMEEDDAPKPKKGKGGDDEDEDEDEDADDSKLQDDDMEEDEDDDDIGDILDDMDMVTGADDEEDSPVSGSDELATLRELTTNAIPKMSRLANPEALSDESLQIQTFALSALGNIAWSVAIFDFTVEDNAPILKLWAPAARAIWEQVVGPVLGADTADVELATSITSLAWAVSRTLTVDALPLQGTEHRRFISLYGASRNLPTDNTPQQPPTGARRADNDPLQGLGVKCIGVLGQLARHPAPAALNREIGVFLLTVISSLPDSPAADVVEALNQLFDIYADEEHPCDKEVFWKDNFLPHLESLIPKIRAMIKTIDKRTHAELRTRADEAILNLPRFLAYKKKHQPQTAA